MKNEWLTSLSMHDVYTDLYSQFILNPIENQNGSMSWFTTSFKPRRRNVAAQEAQELKTVTYLPLLWRNAEKRKIETSSFTFYFRNCSSNTHQECCEDNPTKCLFQSDDFALHSTQTWQMLKLYYDSHILDSILSYGIHTWHDGRLMHGISAHVGFDDLDLDARSVLNYFDN